MSFFEFVLPNEGNGSGEEAFSDACIAAEKEAKQVLIKHAETMSGPRLKIGLVNAVTLALVESIISATVKTPGEEARKNGAKLLMTQMRQPGGLLHGLAVLAMTAEETGEDDDGNTTITVGL